MSFISQRLKLCEKTFDLDRFCSAFEMVGAEVFLKGSIFDHIVGGGEHGGRDCPDCLFGTVPGALAMELGLQITPFCARACPGTWKEGRLQPGGAFTHSRGMTLPGTLIVLGAQAAGPGDQMPGRRKPAHIGADLG